MQVEERFKISTKEPLVFARVFSDDLTTFQYIWIVGIRTGTVRSQFLASKTVTSYFQRHPSESLSRAVAIFGISYSTVLRVPKKLVHMFLYRMKSASITTWRFWWRFSSSQSILNNMSSSFSPSRRIFSSDECVFHVSRLAISLKVFMYAAWNSKRNSTTWITQRKSNILVCGVAHDVVGPYFIINETLREVGYYRMLVT